MLSARVEFIDQAAFSVGDGVSIGKYEQSEALRQWVSSYSSDSDPFVRPVPGPYSDSIEEWKLDLSGLTLHKSNRKGNRTMMERVERRRWPRDSD